VQREGWAAAGGAIAVAGSVVIMTSGTTGCWLAIPKEWLAIERFLLLRTILNNPK